MIYPITHIEGQPFWKDIADNLPATDHELAAIFSYPLHRIQAMLAYLKRRKVAKPSKRTVKNGNTKQGPHNSILWVRV